MSLHTRIAVLLALWAFALVPLLFVRTEWFGRPLSDQQIGEYLHAEDPRLIQHALGQIGDRMARRDGSVNIWYADLLRLSANPSADVRAMDASVIASNPAQPGFRDALLILLRDTSRPVRFRAALALANMGDASGRREIVSGLQSWVIVAPEHGRIRQVTRVGSSVRPGTVIASVEEDGSGVINLVAPVNGHVSASEFKTGETAARGTELVRVEPGPEAIAEILGGLSRVGAAEDLPTLDELAERTTLPERIRQQAAMASKAIRVRTGNPELPARPLSQKN